MLICHNNTGVAVVLAATTHLPGVSRTVPANSDMDLTSEMRTCSGAQFTAIEVLRAAGTLSFRWSGFAEYATGTLVTTVAGAHAGSHVTGGSDVIANAVAGGAAGLMTGADKTKLDALPTAYNFCGNGADGAAAFTAAGAAVTGCTHEGAGVYRLDRNVNFTTMTVEAGATVKLNGFILRASTSIVNLGTIHADGNAGATGAAGGAAGAAGNVGTVRGGTAGGAGNNAGAGAAGTAAAPAIGATGGAGGTGGNGGGAGGAAGAPTAPTAVQGDYLDSWSAMQVFLPGYNAGTLVFPLGGTGGGGGGDGLTGAAMGGGGGGGGGIAKIASPIIDNSGTGVIRSAGGAGGAGQAGPGGDDDGAGGGGGGGGGWVGIFRTSFTGNAATAPGGAGGAGGALSGAGANGANGTAGSAGTVRHFTI